MEILLHVGLVLGSGIVSGYVTVAVLKNDVKWMKRWADKHEESDNTRFQELHERINAL